MQIDFEKLDQQGINEVRDALFTARLRLEKLKGSRFELLSRERAEVIHAIRTAERQQIRAAVQQSEFRQSRLDGTSWGDFVSKISIH